ncbi:uncharacterized protein LOC142001902 isoform X7 [Carettochelys insculpta]
MRPAPGRPRTIRSQAGGTACPGDTRKASEMAGTRPGHLTTTARSQNQGRNAAIPGTGSEATSPASTGATAGGITAALSEAATRGNLPLAITSFSIAPPESSRKRSDSSKAEKSAAHKKPGKSKKDSAAPGRDPNPPQVMGDSGRGFLGNGGISRKVRSPSIMGPLREAWLMKIQPEASQKAPDPPSQAGSALDTAPPTLFKTTEPLCPVRMEGTGLLPSCRGTPPLCRKAPQIQQEATENHSQDCCTPEADSVLAETSKDHCVPKEEIKLLHPQVLLEASHKTTDHSSQAGSTLAAELSAPPGTTEEPHPIRTEEAELEQLDTCQEDSGYPYQACSAQSTPSETLEDPRSAAILARKEEIEQSYQQYSLAFAVVATLLLQKEPSMEAAMGSALRANLRQVGGHCLRQLEHFICSYDAGASHS